MEAEPDDHALCECGEIFEQHSTSAGHPCAVCRTCLEFRPAGNVNDAERAFAGDLRALLERHGVRIETVAEDPADPFAGPMFHFRGKGIDLKIDDALLD